MDRPAISDRLIVALDVPTDRQALELVEQLDGCVNFFKIGLELFSSGTGLQLIDELVNRGFKVFADFKFLDIPNTVQRAVRNLNGRGIQFVTVHAQRQTMEAAVEAAENISILAVTVLTSLNEEELRSEGYGMNATDLVSMRTVSAFETGCAGVVSSPQEAAMIRKLTGEDFSIVTPAIREPNAPANDQMRTLTVTQACSAGANYFVVGRPIRESSDPKTMALKFQAEINRIERLNHESH